MLCKQNGQVDVNGVHVTFNRINKCTNEGTLPRTAAELLSTMTEGWAKTLCKLTKLLLLDN